MRTKFHSSFCTSSRRKTRNISRPLNPRVCMRDLPRDIRLSAFYDRLNIEIGANNRAKQHVSKYDARSLFIFLASFRRFSPLSASEHPRHPNCYHFFPPEISVNRELKWGKSPTFDPFPLSHRALELRKIERKQAI